MSIWGRAISRRAEDLHGGGQERPSRDSRRLIWIGALSKVLRLPLLQESGRLRQKRTGSIELPRGVSDHGSRGARL